MYLPKCISTLTKFVDDCSSRFSLAGVHIKRTHGNWCMAEATDGRALARVQWEDDENNPNRGEVFISYETVLSGSDLCKAAKAAAATIGKRESRGSLATHPVHLDETTGEVEGNVTISAPFRQTQQQVPVCQGRYPKTDDVFTALPLADRTTVRVRCEYLKAMCDLAVSMGSEWVDLKFLGAADTVIVETRTGQGELHGLICPIAAD
jgi:hypothetical protein